MLENYKTRTFLNDINYMNYLYLVGQKPEYLEIGPDVKDLVAAPFQNAAVVLVNEEYWLIPKNKVRVSKEIRDVYPIKNGDEIFILVPGLEGLVKAKFVDLLPPYAHFQENRFKPWFDIRDSEKHGSVQIDGEEWILPFKLILRELS